MSMRPVDMQVVVPRSAEVGKINTNQGTRADEQQQIFSQNLQRQMENEVRQVNETEKTEKSRVDKDAENRNKQKYKKQGKKEGDKENGDEKKKKKSGGSMYDISL